MSIQVKPNNLLTRDDPIHENYLGGKVKFIGPTYPQ